ncbi:MAG: FAD-dependent oxidoreductase, partial [Hyphomicrobium sp.]|nr:FAD-dependent oxidoreductase [Hyphomicrobium sp.]
MLGFDQRAATLHDTDILVVGGGAAGVAAAVTAARQGLRVTLVEKYGFCGGGAVAGMSGTICGMYEASDAPDSRPVQVVHGFLDEFVRLMEARGGLAPPVRYGKTFTRVHDPLIWRDVADALLEEAGVTVVYHAMATSVLVEGGERVEGAVIFTKEGPLRVRAKLTVDASGDADLVAMAGFPSFVGQNGKVQNPTMIFRLLGVDVDRFVGRYGTDTIMPDEISELIREKNVGNEYRLPRAKIWLFPTTRPNELLYNCTRIVGKDGRELNVLYAKDFTEAEIEGRKQIREYARFFRDNLAGCANSVINDSGVQVGVRQTRQAKGVAMLRNVDVTQGTKFKDGIARSPWPIELHTGTKPKVEWLINDFYEVPYGCFVPERGEGLLVAGRCLSAEHEAVASARVTAQCFSYGH